MTWAIRSLCAILPHAAGRFWVMESNMLKVRDYRSNNPNVTAVKPIFYSAKKIVPLIQLIIAMPRGRGTTFRAD
jgi:hypothetical protein